ncbi:MAG: nucleotide exchange factor GrpE [Rhodobiaceae bacterium]|nr:nucleotide exchange factor GrpE [Rhodobiaceae bacterium]RPF97811.1 MAG: nucleotide exchange factor GrpE [Rhizobiales bacterium TMED227]|tara:strand:+ start:26536 stop:27126 length:591 start_codon:yes stop_codon:yes gene_type:complete
MENTEDKKSKKEEHIEVTDTDNLGENTREEEGAIASDENSIPDLDHAGQIDELNDRLLRMAAEIENLRKRSLKEREDAIKYSTTKFARDIITVADDLERAIESVQGIDFETNDTMKTLYDGVELTLRSLTQIFSRNGIERFDPLGEKFDPTMHEAMFEVPNSENESGIIVHLVEPGYRLNDRILRPARVGVSKSDK